MHSEFSKSKRHKRKKNAKERTFRNVVFLIQYTLTFKYAYTLGMSDIDFLQISDETKLSECSFLLYQNF